MIFRYAAPSDHTAGGFSFHLNEASINTLRRARTYNRRGRRRSTVVTMHVTGKLMEVYGSSGQISSQAEVTDAINGLETEFLADLTAGSVTGLYLDDGTTPTSHILTSADAMDGVKVLQIGYERNGGAEYTNLRSFSIVLQAEYPQSGLGGDLQYYRESIRTVGTGGAKKQYLPTWGSGVQEFDLWNATPQHLYQRGEIITFSATPVLLIPSPLYTDIADERMVEHFTPDNRVIGSRDYRARWSYHMIRIGASVVTAPLPSPV